MTLLSACQSAAIPLIGKKPSTIFSATDPFSLEMQEFANEGARDIASTHPWQALITTRTITADGVTENFPLPHDYDRMLLDSSIYDGQNWAWGYSRIQRADEWLKWKIRGSEIITPGAWALLDNQIKFLPAPVSGTAEFLYISKNVVVDQNGAEKQAFTTDTDSFVLSERLLTLWIIWKWRELKRLDASTDQANFEKAFGELSARDGGAAIIRSGSRSRFPGAVPAWPWELG